jgi:transcription elongation GreA/GreB family factor
MNDTQATETWLLEQVAQADTDTREVRRKLLEVSREQGNEAAATLAELAETALVEQGRIEDALSILRLRIDWMPLADARLHCAAALERMLGKSPESAALIKSCGIKGRVPLAECLARLERLRAMQAGALCVDRTWGFGIIQGVDYFYQKVAVNFDRKPNHELAMGYAAESLEILTDDHILARRHNDPASIEALIENDPAEVVRITLRSYGPLNPVLLQEKLSPDVIPADQWKTFWAAARKALKADPKAIVPTKRTEPILLKDTADVYGETWFSQLKSDRDIESILSKISDWLAIQTHQETDPLHLAVIEDRMAFVVKGADLMGETVMPRAMMLAHQIGGEVAEHIDVTGYVNRVLEGNGLIRLLGVMSAKDMKAFVAFLLRVDRDKTLVALIAQLPQLDVTSLTEVLQLLIREGAEDACRQSIKGLMMSRRAEVEVLSWLSKNMDTLAEWELCAASEFAEILLLELEKDYSGLRLKAQNQLRDRFTQKAWVKNLFDQLGEEGRATYFQRLKDSSAWPTMEKRSVLGHIIKLYPELEKLMTSRATDKGGEEKPRDMTTSIRAFRERQLLFERIKKVDIPQNSKDIAHAREYGDLRENFEYKAAKETQGILMRRQAELQQMLAQVVPTEFENLPHDVVGVGTGVNIAYSDGREERFYILGVWDRDEALGIISCESKLAQALDGHKINDEVVIPTEHGEAMVRITGLTSLSDAVKAWIRDVPETLEGRSVTS